MSEQKVRLEISRCIAPDNLWFWAVLFDSGHIFAASKESYESAEICAAAASTEGLDALHAAERAAKNLPPLAAASKQMEFPTFDSDGDPTDETLAAIEHWETNFELAGDPWAKFIEFCKESWNLDYGKIREEQDVDGKSLLCFTTGGWSANESVQGAMNRNVMFRLMRWHSSYRGGLVKYSTK